MIKSFKHKGLQKYYDSGKLTGIQVAHKKRLRLQLIAIDTANNIDDVDIPGFNLHPLKGKRKEWARNNFLFWHSDLVSHWTF